MKLIGLIGAILIAVLNTAQAEPQETPFFKREVVSGKLSRVDERLPSDPATAGSETIGNPGGELRMLMGGPKDTRMMVVYGYARLVGYTPADGAGRGTSPRGARRNHGSIQLDATKPVISA